MATRWKTGEIAHIAQSARSVIARHGLTIKVSSCPISEGGRLGRWVIVVPKRIGDAPTRNRCKRRLRSLRMLLCKDPSHQQLLDRFDCMIYVRRSIALVPYDRLWRLFQEFIECLSVE